MKRTNRRGLSTGTIVMLTVTCLCLIGFCWLFPRLTGTPDIRTNALELAVKLDESFSQLLSAQSSQQSVQKPLYTPLPVVVAPVSTPEPTAEPVRRFSLCATGSVKIDSLTLKSMTDKDIGYRFDLLLSSLGDTMQSDLTIVTAENSFIPTDKLTDTNMPTEVLTAMKTAGVDAVSLGHPAVLNAGVEGLRSTKNSITSAGMIPYGVYASADERSNSVIYDTRGVKVALLSYQNELSSTGKNKTTTEERAFVYAPLETETIRSDIQAMRQNGAEVVIVSLCWGKTDATSPTSTQRQQAQEIADAGADIILGTHSQAVFPVEILTAQRGDGRYHPVLCAYSLGNLFTYDRDKRANLAGILMHADVMYNPADGTVAFDGLTYTPTYCWRGKMDSVTRTAVLLADTANAPDFVDDKQSDIMGRCYTLITEVMSQGILTQKY